MLTETRRQQDAETGVESLVSEIVAAMVNGRIYWSDHPRVQESIGALQRCLLDVTATTGSDTTTLTLADGYLVFQQRPLLGATMAASKLIAAIERIGSGGLQLSAQATKGNLQALLEVLLARETPSTGPDGEPPYAVVNEALARRGAGCIELLPPYRDGARGGATAAHSPQSTGDDESAGSLYVPLQMYQSVMELLQNVTVDVCQGGRIRFDAVKETAERILQRLVSDGDSMLNLARHDQYDAFTFGHSVRVSVLALNFGRAVTSDQDVLIRLGTAALLHDVGKSLVPFEILHSRSALDADEREIIRQHAELGARILVDHEEADPAAIAAAFGHHHSHGRAGYPRTRHAHAPSTLTELIKICDVFEALTAARPYKRPMSPARAYRIMINMGGHFDRGLLKRFVYVNGLYPKGQLVELSTGEIAEVTGQNDGELHRPLVTLLSDREGVPLDPRDRGQVDLTRLTVGPDARHIVRAFDRVELEAVLRAMQRAEARRKQDRGPSEARLEFERREIEQAHEMITHGDACSHREMVQDTDWEAELAAEEGRGRDEEPSLGSLGEDLEQMFGTRSTGFDKTLGEALEELDDVDDSF